MPWEGPEEELIEGYHSEQHLAGLLWGDLFSEISLIGFLELPEPFVCNLHTVCHMHAGLHDEETYAGRQIIKNWQEVAAFPSPHTLALQKDACFRIRDLSSPNRAGSFFFKSRATISFNLSSRITPRKRPLSIQAGRKGRHSSSANW